MSNEVVFRQAMNGRTWEVRSVDGHNDVVGLIGARADGAYEWVKFDPVGGFLRDAVDSLDDAQAVFLN